MSPFRLGNEEMKGTTNTTNNRIYGNIQKKLEKEHIDRMNSDKIP
jgi:hypothetical protein